MADLPIINIRRGMKNAKMLKVAQTDKPMSFSDALDLISASATSDLIRARVVRQYEEAMHGFLTSINSPVTGYQRELLKELKDTSRFICRFGVSDQFYEQDGQEFDHIELTLEMKYTISVEQIFVVDLLFRWEEPLELISGLHCIVAKFAQTDKDETALWEDHHLTSTHYRTPTSTDTGYVISLNNLLMFKPRLHFNNVYALFKSMGLSMEELDLMTDVVEEASQMFLCGHGQIIFTIDVVHRNTVNQYELIGSATQQLNTDKAPAVLIMHFNHDPEEISTLVDLNDAYVVMDPRTYDVATPENGLHLLMHKN